MCLIQARQADQADIIHMRSCFGLAMRSACHQGQREHQPNKQLQAEAWYNTAFVGSKTIHRPNAVSGALQTLAIILVNQAAQLQQSFVHRVFVPERDWKSRLFNDAVAHALILPHPDSLRSVAHRQQSNRQTPSERA